MMIKNVDTNLPYITSGSLGNILLSITSAQNSCYTKNYIVFGFFQVIFTNCKQSPCQVQLPEDSSNFNFFKRRLKPNRVVCEKQSLEIVFATPSVF